jgi:hypothetical protein
MTLFIPLLNLSIKEILGSTASANYSTAIGEPDWLAGRGHYRHIVLVVDLVP